MPEKHAQAPKSSAVTRVKARDGRRRWLIGLGLGAAILAAAAGYVIAERRAVAARVAEAIAEQAGVGPVMLTVAEVNLRSIVMTGIRLGGADGVSAERIAIGYTPASLLERRLESLSIDGLRGVVAIAGAGSVLPLPGSRPGDAPDAAAAVPLPLPASWTVDRMTLTNGIIQLTGPVSGRIELDGIGSLRATPGGFGAADVALSARADRIESFENVRLDATATLTRNVLSLQMMVAADQGSLMLDWNGRFEETAEAEPIRGNGTVGVGLTDVDLGDGTKADLHGRWQVAMLDGKVTARPETAVDAVVRIDGTPVAIHIPSAPAALATADLQAGRSLRFEAPMVRITADDRTVELRNIRMTVPDEAAGAVRFDASAVRLMDGPDDLPPLSVHAQVTTGTGRHAVSARLADPAGAIDLVMAGDVDRETGLFEGELRTIVADQPIGEDATLSLTGAWRMTAGADGITATPRETVTASVAGTAGARVRIEAAPQTAPALAITTTADGTALMAVQLRSTRITTAPPATDPATIGPALVVRGLAATVVGLDRPLLTAVALRFNLEGVEPWIAALASGSATIDAEAAGGSSVFAAEARLARGLRATLSGRHGIADGISGGEADIRFDPVNFRTGGRQPHQFYPPLRPLLADVTGRVGLTGRLRWTGGQVTPSGAVTLENVSFQTDGVRVAGVNGTVRFNRLSPPTTPQGQTLSIEEIDPGVPLRDVTVRFHLDGRGRPAVEGLDFRYFGGTVVTDRITIDDRSGRIDTTVRLANVDLRALVAVSELDDLTASGQIAGTVPIRIERGRFAIAAGRLAADGPGRLVYRPAIPPAALQGAGDQGSLILKALENFQFSALSIELDGQSGGDWVAVARIDGRNPDVLDGQSFRFNINLAGDIEETIRAALFGSDVAKRLEQRLQQP